MALTVTPAELTATALTLTTAAQPNITSVGTLSGLTTAGVTMSNGGDRSLTGPLNQSLLLNARPNDATEGLKLQINGANKLSVLLNGSITVGGAGAPRTVGWGDTKLQIEGTGATDSSISIIRNEAGDNPPYFVFAKSRTGSIGSNTVVQDNDYLGVLRFNGADGTDLGNSAAQIHVEVDGTPATDDVPGALVFSTNAIGDGSSAASEKLRIAAGGNVGIGNTSPNAELHIGTGSNTDVAVGSQTNPALQIGGTNNYRLALYTDAETGYIENKNGDDGISFRVKTAGEAMVIDGGTGNVGIGTDNPGAQLQIYNASAGNLPLLRTMSHASAAGSFNGDYSVEFRHATSTVTHAMLVTNVEADDSRRTLDVADSNGVFASFVNGKVGIGLTNPSSNLHIRDESSNTNTSNNVLRIESQSTGTTTTGFGGAIYWLGERNGDGALQAMCRIKSDAEVNSGTTLSSGLVFETATAGVPSEKFRIKNNGNQVTNNVREHYERVNLTNNVSYTFDIDVKSIGASGQIIEVFAGYTHHSTTYGAVLKQIYAQRSTAGNAGVYLVSSTVNHSTSQAGAWSFTFVDADTVRLTKSAGSYTGSGWGYILVRSPN